MLAYGLAMDSEKYFKLEDRKVIKNEEGLKEALTAHGLAYSVEMKQLNHPLKNNPIPFYASIRTDTGAVLGAGLSDRYKPIQNEDGFSLIADLAQEAKDGVFFARGMTFDKGRVAVAQIDLGEMTIGDTGRDGFRDVVRKRVTWTNSHDGSGSAKVFTTPIRIVCANTLTAAIGRSSDGVNIRHTETAKAKMDEARKLLKVINGQLVKAETAFNVLARTKVNNEVIRDVLTDLFPTEGKEEKRGAKNAVEAVNHIKHFYADADGGRVDPNTGWNLYNAITHYTDHVSPVRSHGPIKDYAEARAQSTLTGAILEKNTKALKVVIDRLEIQSEIDKLLAMVDLTPLQPAQPVSQVDAILAMVEH